MVKALARLLGKYKMVAIRRRSVAPITRLGARRNRLAGPAYNTRGAVRMTARQLVDWDPENAPAPPSATRHPDGHLFAYAQRQLTTIRATSGLERDLALYDLFERVACSRPSSTWVHAYQRIAVHYINSGLGPIGDIACAGFLLTTFDA